MPFFEQRLNVEWCWANQNNKASNRICHLVAQNWAKIAPEKVPEKWGGTGTIVCHWHNLLWQWSKILKIFTVNFFHCKDTISHHGVQSRYQGGNAQMLIHFGSRLVGGGGGGYSRDIRAHIDQRGTQSRYQGWILQFSKNDQIWTPTCPPPC